MLLSKDVRPRALTAGIPASPDLLRLGRQASHFTESGLLFCKMGQWADKWADKWVNTVI